MSVKAPAPMAISTTPPSKVDSRSKLLRKDNLAVAVEMAMVGVSSTTSVTTAGSGMKAALGAVSAGGAGVPALEVTQLTVPGGPVTTVAVHPAGSAGATPPSKFSVKAVRAVPSVNV